MTKLSGKTNLYDYVVTMFEKKNMYVLYTNHNERHGSSIKSVQCVYFTHNLRIWQLLHLFAMYLHTIDVR